MDKMRGWKWRLALRLYGIGFKYRKVWLMELSDKMRKAGYKEYV